MTPQLLEKLKQLIEAGATILGQRPVKSPSLANYPACDATVKGLADAIWADCDGKKVKEHRFGQGKAVCGKGLEEVLAELALPPDFEVLSKVSGFPPRYIHRRDANTEIYFVANSNAFPVTVDCAFRVGGMRPELWRPDLGRIDELAGWQEKRGRTFLTLQLDPSGSVFVVFRRSETANDPVVKLMRNGDPISSGNLLLDTNQRPQLLVFEPGTYELQTASGRSMKVKAGDFPVPSALAGPWEVSFPTNRGPPTRATFEQLASWTASKDPGIKYFSGTAFYRKTMIMPPPLLQPNRRLYLDLGKVQVIAEVKLNGRPMGTLWKPPFELEITDQAKAGTNLLEVAEDAHPASR